MAVDYLDIGNLLVVLITLGLLMLSSYRAIEFGRVLVGATYKSRAKWTAAFLATIAFLLVDSTGMVPYLSSDQGNTGFVLITLALPFFINGNVRTAQETDFFHRDTLHWRALWKANLSALFGLVALSVVAILITGSLPGSGSASSFGSSVASLYFLVLVVESIYGTATLITAARSSEDRTMRRFVRMLGLSLLGLVLFFTVWIPIDYFAPGVGDFLSEFGFVMAAYFLYRAVMSLSPLGKLEKPASSAIPTAVAGP